MKQNYAWLAYHFGLVPANGCKYGTRGFTFANNNPHFAKFISTEDFCAILRVARHCFLKGREVAVHDHDRLIYGCLSGADELFIRSRDTRKPKFQFWLSKSATHHVLNRVINTDFRWIQRTKRGPKWISK